MKKYLSRRKKKMVLAALLTGLCLVTPWNRAEAVTSYTTPNGLIRLDYYGAGESFTDSDGDIWTSDGTLPDWQKERINFAADYWDGLLKHTSTAKQPAVLVVASDVTFNNASATPFYYKMDEGKPVVVTVPNAVLNHGITLTADDGLGCYEVSIRDEAFARIKIIHLNQPVLRLVHAHGFRPVPGRH